MLLSLFLWRAAVFLLREAVTIWTYAPTLQTVDEVIIGACKNKYHQNSCSSRLSVILAPSSCSVQASLESTTEHGSTMYGLCPGIAYRRQCRMHGICTEIANQREIHLCRIYGLCPGFAKQRRMHRCFTLRDFYAYASGRLPFLLAKPKSSKEKLATADTFHEYFRGYQYRLIQKMIRSLRFDFHPLVCVARMQYLVYNCPISLCAGCIVRALNSLNRKQRSLCTNEYV